MPLPGVSDNVFVTAGYSSIATRVVFIIAVVVAILPIGFYMRLKETWSSAEEIAPLF